MSDQIMHGRKPEDDQNNVAAVAANNAQRRRLVVETFSAIAIIALLVLPVIVAVDAIVLDNRLTWTRFLDIATWVVLLTAILEIAVLAQFAYGSIAMFWRNLRYNTQLLAQHERSWRVTSLDTDADGKVTDSEIEAAMHYVRLIWVHDAVIQADARKHDIPNKAWRDTMTMLASPRMAMLVGNKMEPLVITKKRHGAFPGWAWNPIIRENVRLADLERHIRVVIPRMFDK